MVLKFHSVPCSTPFGVKHKLTGETIPVPCGKCPDCVARRVSSWSFRLLQEEKISTSAWFITLTYDTLHVPITRAGFMSINKKHCQDFFKRLRKAHEALPLQPTIKYFLAAEYGEKQKSYRPHYHIILFNADITLIQTAWGMGHVHYGQVSGASVGYTLKYMSKRSIIPMHRNDDREPEFRLMSKGLGKNYLNDRQVAWHLKNPLDRTHCTLDDGRKIAMPRYYKDKIYSELYFESAEQALLIRKRVAYFNRQKMVADELLAMRNGGPTFFQDRAEKLKEKFRVMKIKSSQNQKI